MAYSATDYSNWDSTKPAGTETPSVLDDALREVKVCVENEFDDIALKLILPGLVIRPKFVYKDADEIYINPGAYHHDGTSEQLVYWDSQLTYTFAALGASDWSYLYLDDSAIVTAGTNLLTASEFIDSTTEPAWSAAKHGWYNGNDRCIFAVFTNGSSEILEFFHAADLVVFADRIENQSALDVDTTYLDIGALKIPKFAIEGIISGLCTAHNVTYYWRTNGQTGSTGHLWGLVQVNSYNVNPGIVVTDASQVIELKNDVGGTETIQVWTEGWRFPEGV